MSFKIVPRGDFTGLPTFQTNCLQGPKYFHFFPLKASSELLPGVEKSTMFLRIFPHRATVYAFKKLICLRVPGTRGKDVDYKRTRAIASA
ncbi:hypothetical protein PVK06_010612 [Gossypium arboreum]|uniref:Uncharacterized protein n=1 Tax=Gossypium arboreum TaxID=29729 RepID=A0ABR0Q788_GOSAR|nr:hypothetical protein PVK06_010612 [Gossypium arboreum]